MSVWCLSKLTTYENERVDTYVLGTRTPTHTLHATVFFLLGKYYLVGQRIIHVLCRSHIHYRLQRPEHLVPTLGETNPRSALHSVPLKLILIL